MTLATASLYKILFIYLTHHNIKHTFFFSVLYSSLSLYKATITLPLYVFAKATSVFSTNASNAFEIISNSLSVKFITYLQCPNIFSNTNLIFTANYSIIQQPRHRILPHPYHYPKRTHRNASQSPTIVS